MHQEVANFIAAVDTFIEQPKRLVGANASFVGWMPGRDRDEARLIFPLEIAGEQLGHTLIISAFPDSPTLRFRLILMFLGWDVSRLDFDQNVKHANRFPRFAPTFGRGRALPGLVTGPHWHSWQINKETIHSLANPFKLPYALPFTETQQFDASLRWFCAKHSIELDHHNIVYPHRVKLI